MDQPNASRIAHAWAALPHQVLAGHQLTERRARYARGHWAELMASAVLMLRGYRILARRLKTRAGEIDLIAIRGGRLVFVEVKHRPTLEDAEASITWHQSERLRAAAELWFARRPRYHLCEMRFDAVFVVPGSWPRHVRDGA